MNNADRIDWSQLWYPGPRRVFTAAELERAGGDRPSRTFLMILAVNAIGPATLVLQLAPASVVWMLAALMLTMTVVVWRVAMALWRGPSRRRLLESSLGLVGFFLVAVLVGRGSGLPVEDSRWLSNVVAGSVALAALALWFVTSFRGHQIEARLRELDERERAIDMARQLATAQIQPHFLFNSLASLQHWVDSGDPRASSLLRSLTGYLRATLPLFKREKLTLGEELDAAVRYLEVMQARLGERLRFSVDADAAARAQAVPPGLLLTLVENAVEHGVGPSLSGADVQVAARRAGERLLVEVADSGAGLPPAVAEGVGLANSRARLKQAYGDQARLQLLPRPAGGTIARLSMPLISDDIDSP
ncbi:sensor histidine kinase [Aquabacterium humicola]|uniref:sensor histidine kinase n=1 Tax=Aquabacterium humicola TaxID=3237377 RepID=UPI00254347F7|nr:histidine kinase [Rubrivivax pictus]